MPFSDWLLDFLHFLLSLLYLHPEPESCCSFSVYVGPEHNFAANPGLQFAANPGFQFAANPGLQFAANPGRGRFSSPSL
jgi:hypothetical protein